MRSILLATLPLAVGVAVWSSDSSAQMTQQDQQFSQPPQVNQQQLGRRSSQRDRAPVVLLRDWNYDTIYGRGWSLERLIDEAEVIGATGEVLPCTTTDLAESEGNLRERPLRLLTSLRQKGEGLTGFRYFHDHDPRVLPVVLEDPACAKIILTRNPIESYVSLKIAQATGQWKLTNAKNLKTALHCGITAVVSSGANAARCSVFALPSTSPRAVIISET